MMMNIYYSSNRNNIDDTNKLFYKVVIFPNFTKFTLYIDLIHDITGVHSGVGEFCVTHRRRGCVQLHREEHGGTAGGLCHLHGHCGLCEPVQAQALWLVVLSCYTADGTAGSYLWHSVHAGSNCGKF